MTVPISSLPQILSSINTPGTTLASIADVNTINNPVHSQTVNISNPILVSGSQITSIASPAFTISNQSLGNQSFVIGHQPVSIGNQSFVIGNQSFEMSNQPVAIDNQAVTVCNQGLIETPVINDVLPSTVPSMIDQMNTVMAASNNSIQTTLPLVDTLIETPIEETVAMPATVVQEVTIGALGTAAIPHTAQSYIQEELNGQQQLQPIGELIQGEEFYIATPITDSSMDIVSDNMYSQQFTTSDSNMVTDMQYSSGQYISEQATNFDQGIDGVTEQTVITENVGNVIDCNEIVQTHVASNEVINNTLVSEANNLTNTIPGEPSVLMLSGDVNDIVSENTNVLYDTLNVASGQENMVVDNMGPEQDMVPVEVCTEGMGLEVTQGSGLEVIRGEEALLDSEEDQLNMS